MGVRKLLAILTAGSSFGEVSTGGIRNITKEDLLTALGYAQRDVFKKYQRMKAKPLNHFGTPIGALIVQVRYIGSAGADFKKLQDELANWLYITWPKYCPKKTETVSISNFDRLGYVMAHDFCETETRNEWINKCREKTQLLENRKLPEYIKAQKVGMDSRTWNRKFKQFYDQRFMRLNDKEADVIEAMRRRLFDHF